MINENENEKLIIRQAKLEEFDYVLPELAARSYGDRFFNFNTIENSANCILKKEGDFIYINTKEKNEKFLEYGGCLSIPFTCLKPQESGAGQSFESFRRYWMEKKADSNFKVYVAEFDGKIVGFVKGNFEYVDCNSDFPDVVFPDDVDKNRIISLGSLYVDPNCRKGGIGTKLVKFYMQEAIKSKPDFSGFLTDCYWRNNSQYFFNKLGAVSIGFCNIPDLYLDENLERKTQNIVGEVMFWSKEKVNELLTSNIEKGKVLANEKYMRNKPEYSAMVVANGNMEEFKTIKRENLGYWASKINQTNNQNIKGAVCGFN